MPNGWPIVTVRIDANGSVDKEKCHISKSKHEQIAWKSDTEPFHIRFDFTPFSAEIFHVPAGGKVESGPPRDDADEGEYPYTVIAEARALASADPVIVVDP